MANPPTPKPLVEADFGPDFSDYEPKLRQMALEIGNELLRDEPEKTRTDIIRIALERARRWWLDRAG
ncbi:uncharacterized protein YdaT [Lewinella marina]|uniref:Uncharacterized protein n=1 Tax=Neolewinella marina TaxID=438751 RepID=A0A2G0CHL1_9BACT|nr:hypothetical protein [Neolewinella marina]NJB86073.1 uncharacterized protein YdaT [Neolewinella marina]PHK99448.1 hypothetical protein CGL56_08325 [Neolewinella marina]